MELLVFIFMMIFLIVGWILGCMVYSDSRFGNNKRPTRYPNILVAVSDCPAGSRMHPLIQSYFTAAGLINTTDSPAAAPQWLTARATWTTLCGPRNAGDVNRVCSFCPIEQTHVYRGNNDDPAYIHNLYCLPGATSGAEMWRALDDTYFPNWMAASYELDGMITWDYVMQIFSMNFVSSVSLFFVDDNFREICGGLIAIVLLIDWICLTATTAYLYPDARTAPWQKVFPGCRVTVRPDEKFAAFTLVRFCFLSLPLALPMLAGLCHVFINIVTWPWHRDHERLRSSTRQALVPAVVEMHLSGSAKLRRAVATKMGYPSAFVEVDEDVKNPMQVGGGGGGGGGGRGARWGEEEEVFEEEEEEEEKPPVPVATAVLPHDDIESAEARPIGHDGV